jgi:putative tricarboxylic transport membrane protein
VSERGADERAPVHRGGLIGPRIVAGVLLVGAAFLVTQALEIQRGGGYSVVGPGTIPLAATVGLFVLAAALALRTTLLPDTDLAVSAAEEERACYWPTIGIVGALLVLYAVALNGVRLGSLAIPGLGYIVATAVFLPAGARALGSRSLVRDVVIAVVLAIVVYFGFTEFLGVRLPGGVLDAVLP